MATTKDTNRRLAGTDLVPGVLATAALGGAFLALHLPVLAAAGVAVAVYGGTRLLMSAVRPPGSSGEPSTDEVVARGREKVAKLREIANSTEKPSVRANIAHICVLAEQIFGIFIDDPTKTPLARGFVEFTLDQTLTIVKRYRDLSARPLPNAKETLDKAESLLATIDASLSEQIGKLMREDLADLDSQIEVLQTRLDLEEDDHA